MRELAWALSQGHNIFHWVSGRFSLFIEWMKKGRNEFYTTCQEVFPEGRQSNCSPGPSGRELPGLCPGPHSLHWEHHTSATHSLGKNPSSLPQEGPSGSPSHSWDARLLRFTGEGLWTNSPDRAGEARLLMVRDIRKCGAVERAAPGFTAQINSSKK